MGLRINQNIAAMNAYRNLSVTDSQMSKSLEKLSSGFRINRAADDAAGLSISEGLRAQVGGLKVAVRNAQDAISVTQTAEGAMNEVTTMLQRMRDLAVQANNASLDDDAKSAAQQEFSQLSSEIDRIGTTTAFGKAKLLDGSFGQSNELLGTGPVTTLPAAVSFNITNIGGTAITPIAVSVSPATTSVKDFTDDVNAAIKTALTGAGYNGNEVMLSSSVADDGSGASFKFTGAKAFTLGAITGAIGVTGAASTPVSGASSGDFQIGANSGETLSISINGVSTTALALTGLDLTTPASVGPPPVASGAATSISKLDDALKTVSSQRAELGAYQNRFEHTINNLNVSVENLSASESRIRDTDMAQEMVSYTRSQILTQAGTSMLAQANQASQNVLTLLR